MQKLEHPFKHSGSLAMIPDSCILFDMRENEGSRMRRPPFIPRQYGGKWVGWSLDGREILGAGDTLAEVQEISRQKGRPEIAIEWVPPADKPFIGLGSV